MALTQKQVSELYVAIFNRASEGSGNKYWQTEKATSAATADAMLATPDAKTYFGTKLDSKQAFIEHIYLNTLNKTYAQDKAGVDYWVSQLDAGKSRGEVVAELVYAVSTYKDSTDPVTKAAYDQFNNRVDVSNYMADTVEKAPADYSISTKFATSGTTGLVVTNSASTVTTAKTSVDTLKPVDGKTFSLTAGADNFALTNGDDTVNGTFSTLNANDRIIDNTTADKDVLNVELLGGASVPSTVEIKNVETLNFNVLSGTATVDATNYSGYNTVANTGTGTLALTNLKSTSAEYVMKGATGGLNLAFAAAAVAGTDTVKVTLDGTTSGALTVGTATEKVENVVLTTKNSAATLTSFTAANATSVTIKGGQGFKLLDSTPLTGFANATTIDAREAGKAEFAATATAAVAILTGASDDKITLGRDFNTNDLFNLGAGNDTLVVDVAGGASSGNAATFIGVENVIFKSGVTSAIDMTKADQKAALTFEGGAAIDAKGLAAGSTVTSTKNAVSTVNVEFRDSVMGEKSTIDLQKGTTAAGAVTLKNIKDATINYGADSIGAITLDASTDGTEVTTDLTVNAKGGALTGLALATAGELKNLTLNATAGTIAATAIATVNKLDTLVVNATKDVTLAGITSANTAAMTKIELNATGGKIDAGTITNTAAIANAGSIKDVTVTGTKDVKAIFTLNKGNVDKVVSTSTGNTDITITNNGTANEAGSTVTLGNAATGKTNKLSITGDQKQSVIGGTGVDKVTIDGKGLSTITLGAGDDELTVNAGSINTITLGAGKDTIKILAPAGGATTITAANLAEKHTIITDFKGAATDGDIIATASATKFTVAASVAKSATTAATNADGFVTDWGTGVSTTLADKITIAEKTIVAATNAVNKSLLFVDSGKSYLFISDGAAGISDQDTLIELTGISATTGITIDNGNITNIA
ncbi:DUF4214 domain-containing protein [Aliarcobacter cryaerophilus]|uniref:beta strand repeat-containing protein n=1 Tax=Aliarcobacter cryaerophilus TaxID=28198 RepID=UPI003DA5E44C